jgi:hypothetical protein
MDQSFAPKLICVDPALAANVWPLVRPYLDDGFAKHDDFMPEDLLDRVSAGKVLLWVAVVDERIVAAMLTCLLKKRSGLVCRMLATGGTDFSIWKSWHTRIEAYARNEGCVRLESECRQGFLRALTGFRLARIITKRL